MVVVLGLPALVLISAFSNEFGNVLGLASQPFFLYSTWKNKQHGMFLLAILYTLVWIVGVIRYAQSL